ncbi:hypothetical protein KCV04_g22224, partial [Aureobasidium melanogenum]
MSALSTNPNISKLGKFRHDNGPGVLQKIDDEMLNLVRKALQINDLLFVVLIYNLVLPNFTPSRLYEPHPVAHSLQWLRKILAISKLSDKTRSFLSVLLKEIYQDWIQTNRKETRKLEDLLTTFLNLDSLDLQRALGKAS